MSKKSETAIQILEDNTIMIESLLSKEEHQIFRKTGFVRYLEKAVEYMANSNNTN